MKKFRNNINLLNINKKGFPFKNVFVLGGTSEIAHEICKGLVLKGTKRIHLVSRDPTKNNKFILELTKNYKLKITNQKFDLLEENQKIPPIDFFDLYIIAAGYLGNITKVKFDEREALNIAKINYVALVPWISLIASEERINKPWSFMDS